MALSCRFHSRSASRCTALARNTTGHSNTANEASPFPINTPGAAHLAGGTPALFSSTAAGGDHAATEFNAFFGDTTRRGNTAARIDALRNNTIGNDTVTGYALRSAWLDGWCG